MPASGTKSRNPDGKGSLRQGNSLQTGNKNGSFGAISSKSPVMAKSFAIPSNQNTYVLNQSAKGNNGKAGSIQLQKRVSDFDNTLVSNTVDFTHLGSNSNVLAVGPPMNQAGTGNTQKDNQMLYKKMFAGGSGRQQKNLASSYLRGIDNQLRGNANNV